MPETKPILPENATSVGCVLGLKAVCPNKNGLFLEREESVCVAVDF